MRYAATLTLLAVALAAGCRSQSTPLTNPFLTPDRVPPPSTQVLAPGAAQPYYPGETMPGTAPLAAGAPGHPQIPAAAAPPSTFVAPPGAAPPASAYPGPAYPTNPVTPPSPPLNGGVYTPQAKGESIGVPSDEQSMRFASATLAPTTSSASAFSNAAPPENGAAAQPAQFRTPIQSILPVAGSPNPSGVERAFTPNAGMQSPQQASQLSVVTPADYQAPVGAVKATAANGGAPAGSITASSIGAATSPTSSDGFRPQGSQPRTTSEPPSSSGFRPPSIGKQTAGGDSPTGRYGVGPKQEWLRGQLEFHPDGQWAINYMDEGPKDQIGGRVLIDNPQVLANLSPGEFVVVEGQLFGRQLDEATYMPAYRVSSVQRQRQ